MKAGELKRMLESVDDDTECIFAEYEDGRTLLWYLGQCCNFEHQKKVGQLWFNRNLLATATSPVTE